MGLTMVRVSQMTKNTMERLGLVDKIWLTMFSVGNAGIIIINGCSCAKVGP